MEILRSCLFLVCFWLSRSCFQINCDWSYLMFTQQWPPTVCLGWQQESPSHKCINWKGNETWAVHGLWPSNTAGDDPQFCNASLPFNVTVIEPLRKSLEVFWPNMYKGTVDDSFWSHEWQKHGTCAMTDEKLKNEFEYFDSGIQLLKKFNAFKYLKQKEIVPSNSNEVEVSDVESAVKSGLGVIPLLRCYKNKKSGQHLIQELRLCLDKSLQIIECPPQKGKNELPQATQDCPKTGLVLYPTMSINDFQDLHQEL